ncbi:MAG: transposase [Anaerolineales bacterium]|nr:transposase [Anaerolineales bacterium]
MTLSALVVTPHTSFGELICQSLEETGSYRVHIVPNQETAVSCLLDFDCSMAFLDMDLKEVDVEKIGLALREINEELMLVIISSEKHPPTLDSLRPWLLLHKPFYLPDLLQMLGELPPESVQPASQDQSRVSMPASGNRTDTDMPFWMGDVTKAAQYLTRLTLESSAQAALVNRDSSLWAYAGQLSQGAAKELSVTISNHWDNQNGTDLLRFVRLDATNAEHMIYATLLDELNGAVLALVFDAETPFGTIRQQASRLLQSVLPDEEKEAKKTGLARNDFWDTDEDDNEDIPLISDILSSVPPPKPNYVEPASESFGFTRPSKPGHDPNFSFESSPAIQIRDLLGTEQPVNLETRKSVSGRNVIDDELAVTMPSKSKPRPAAPGELDATLPNAAPEEAGHIVLEPVSPALYKLSYACLLIPRFKSNYLTGDIADKLAAWLPEICVAFGWRLEFQAVRPEYLQWVVNVPPATSPGHLMRVMRQQTSERLFNEFGRLKKQNPSGDFWAPGYLIMGGTQPHPSQLVKDYLKQTRQRQGLDRDRLQR